MHSRIQGGSEEPKLLKVRDRHKAGTAPVRVRVTRQARPEQDAEYIPAPGQRVVLQWFGSDGRPTDLQWEAVTDAEGMANFPEVDILKNTQRFVLEAAAPIGDVYQSSGPIVAREGVWQGAIEMMQVTGDPSVIIGGMLIAVLRMPADMNEHPEAYGHVMVEHIIELENSEWSIYSPSVAKQAAEARGVRLEMPLKSQSLVGQAIGGGGGQIEVADSTIFYNGRIDPPAPGNRPARIMVRFFLKASGSRLDYEQPMTRSFADVRVAFIRDTDLPDHPVLDVVLDAPQFAEQTTEPEEGILEGQRVVLARGLSLESGDELVFTVRGLPYPDDPIPIYLAIFVGLMMMGGGFIAWVEYKRRQQRIALLRAGDPSAISAIDKQIDALYAGLAELERDFNEGMLDDGSYLLEQDRLKARVAVLKQRRDSVAMDPASAERRRQRQAAADQSGDDGVE